MEYRGYKIVNDGRFGMKHIKPLGKGSVPKELRGVYTKDKEAMKAIDTYVALKGGSRAKTGSNSGD